MRYGNMRETYNIIESKRTYFPRDHKLIDFVTDKLFLFSPPFICLI